MNKQTTITRLVATHSVPELEVLCAADGDGVEVRGGCVHDLHEPRVSDLVRGGIHRDGFLVRDEIMMAW